LRIARSPKFVSRQKLRLKLFPECGPLSIYSAANYANKQNIKNIQKHYKILHVSVLVEQLS